LADCIVPTGELCLIYLINTVQESRRVGMQWRRIRRIRIRIRIRIRRRGRGRGRGRFCVYI